jgi:proteasome accessory factor B
VARYSGRWYAVGFDTDRQAERVFRLSRVQGAVRRAGPSGSYEIPPGTDVRDIARRLAPPPITERVVVLARTGAAMPLRRAADSVEEGVIGPDGTDGWDRLVLTRGAVDTADLVLGHGPAVYVEAPESLRDRVVSRLRGVVG